MTQQSILTPLMKQHREIKQKYPDAILLFRVGDFYETFGEDAIKTAKILNITLTKRNNGNESSSELAGFPHHAIDNYLHKLVKAGFRVAICDQLEDPKFAKGLVKRGVTEIVTPGLATEDKMITSENNFIAAIHKQDTIFGLALLDLSTADFFVAQGSEKDIINIIDKILPAEILLNKSFKNYFKEILKNYFCFYLDDWNFEEQFAKEKLLNHFKVNSLKGFGLEEHPLGYTAAGIILIYLKDTEHPFLSHINSVKLLNNNDYLWLDNFTVNNLNLFASNDKTIGLFEVINKTATPMGSRLLKNWLLFPLIHYETIMKRLETVSFLIRHPEIRQVMQNHLKFISDVERLGTKISTQKINPKEFLNLATSLDHLEKLKLVANETTCDYLHEIKAKLDNLDTLISKIVNTISENPPANRIVGGYIRSGINKELDELKKITKDHKEVLNQILQKEIENTKISSLKISFNKIYGYYIEVTNVHKDKVPNSWIRKQTLTQAERYVTTELKDYEEKILNAEEKTLKLEEEIYGNLMNEIQPFFPSLKANAHFLAMVDIFVNFAEISLQNNYVKPLLVNENNYLNIEEGRHPIIEKTLALEEQYVPNTLIFDDEKQIIVITGPNMSGKSALLKQTALITILAHIGCFVPAKSAIIPLTDKIFTRLGANDNLQSGESTFMVEMNEAASIINNITPKSLIIFDELGRGTATFDGISIAWSIIEYLHNHSFKPKTLFATHYHEINDLEKILPRVKNFHISYKETDNSILFLRKLSPGSTRHSFGINVAKMAGLPMEITDRSRVILKELESKSGGIPSKILRDIQHANPPRFQVSLFDQFNENMSKLKNDLDKIDLNTLTPVEALLKIQFYKNIMND